MRLPLTERVDACLQAEPEGAHAPEGAILEDSRYRPVSPGSWKQLHQTKEKN